jgi:hypothetical protein
MLHPSTQQLIRKLCELTEDGAIAWKEGEGGASVFETEGYIVEVKEEPPAIRLLHRDGRELERAGAADLATPWPGGDGAYATHVAIMAHRAGRIARGAETAIAKILSSLSAPPRKSAEPEPEPAALAFDPPVSHATPSPESATAMAAVTANLDAQRTNDPPASHSLPEPTPIAVPQATETAIDRVVAIQPAPQPLPPVAVEDPPAPPPVAAEPEPQSTPEPEPGSATPPVLIEPPPIAASAPVEAAVPEPVQAIAQPEPSPPPAAVPAPKAGFGSIDSFNRPRSAPQPDAPKTTSTGLLVRGFSARTQQTVEQRSVRDFVRPVAPEPQPKPAPAPAPAPEKQLEPAIANGADVYKPWS